MGRSVSLDDIRDSRVAWLCPLVGRLEDKEKPNVGTSLFLHEYTHTASYYSDLTFVPDMNSSISNMYYSTNTGVYNPRYSARVCKRCLTKSHDKLSCWSRILESRKGYNINGPSWTSPLQRQSYPGVFLFRMDQYSRNFRLHRVETLLDLDLASLRIQSGRAQSTFSSKLSSRGRQSYRPPPPICCQAPLKTQTGNYCITDV